MHQVSYSEAVKKVVKEKCNGPVHVTEQNIRSNPNKNTGFSDKVNYRHSREQQQTNEFQHPEPEYKDRSISEETFLVNKNNFVAFICTIVNVTMQHPKKSNRIKSVVEAANNFLGIMTKAEEIHEMLNYEGTQVS